MLTLDEIINARRTIRSFSEEFPPHHQIEQIIQAGWLAPYAASTMVDTKDFRQFFVFKRGSRGLSKISGLMQVEARVRLETVQKNIASNRLPAAQVTPFLKRLEVISNQGLLGPGAAPYFIIVAERKGFPPVEQVSLAHCLENMWLKATELGLAFRLFTMTSEMLCNPEFCELLKISAEDYGVNGCAVGYAREELAARPPREFDPGRLITEME